MAKARRKKRMKYTEAKRAEIMAAAKKDGLTALQVQKKFGVTPVTYYSWRKKATGGSPGPRRGRASSRGTKGTGLNSLMRSEVQSRVRAMLPAIVRAEVDSYLNAVLGKGGKRARRS